MKVERIRQLSYSLPFFIMAIGFTGLIKLHWFAIAPTIVCTLFAVSNYLELAPKNGGEKG